MFIINRTVCHKFCLLLVIIQPIPYSFMFLQLRCDAFCALVYLILVSLMLNSCQTILHCCVVFHLHQLTNYFLYYNFVYICHVPPKCGSGFHGGFCVMWMGRFSCFHAYGVCSAEVYIYNDNLWILSLWAWVSVIWGEFEAAAYSFPCAFVSVLALSCCDICESCGASLYAGMWMCTCIRNKHQICAHMYCCTVLHSIHHMWISCVLERICCMH